MAGLLDLSARNPLLRIKKGILSFDVAEGTADAIDDLLFTPKKRLVITSPSGLPPTWKDNGVNPDEFLKWSQSTNFDTLVYPPYRTVNRFSQSVEQEFTRRRNFEPNPASRNFEKEKELAERWRKAPDVDLYREARKEVEAKYDADLKKALTALQRKAKDALLATGTNCLYLAIGSMSWTDETEGRSAAKARKWEAPLYLYPVILEEAERPRTRCDSILREKQPPTIAYAKSFAETRSILIFQNSLILKRTKAALP